ncbi:hypothetical protein GCM10020255_076850 [Rhodococcus baikonurensis]
MTERAQIAFGRVMDLAIALGGTITGEHGVGRLKRDWLPSQLGDDVMALNRKVKDALDPLGILNPGAVIAAKEGSLGSFHIDVERVTSSRNCRADRTDQLGQLTESFCSSTRRAEHDADRATWSRRCEARRRQISASNLHCNSRFRDQSHPESPGHTARPSRATSPACRGKRMSVYGTTQIQRLVAQAVAVVEQEQRQRVEHVHREIDTAAKE